MSTSANNLEDHMNDFLDIVFDGPPGPNTGEHHCQFVEVERPDGTSVNAGEWIDRGNGTWALRLRQATIEPWDLSDMQLVEVINPDPDVSLEETSRALIAGLYALIREYGWRGVMSTLEQLSDTPEPPEWMEGLTAVIFLMGTEQVGWQLIGQERMRQIAEEGFSLQHDREDHGRQELVMAALSYLQHVLGLQVDTWPWSMDSLDSWKPGDEVTALTKAGALIAAEIDRVRGLQ